MKTHLIFNPADKPENMGSEHLIDDVDKWLNECIDESSEDKPSRKSLFLKEALVSKDKGQLDFVKSDGTPGFAILKEVPDDFKI